MGKLFLEGFVLLFILAGRRAGEAVGPQGNRCLPHLQDLQLCSPVFLLVLVRECVCVCGVCIRMCACSFGVPVCQSAYAHMYVYMYVWRP